MPPYSILLTLKHGVCLDQVQKVGGITESLKKVEQEINVGKKAQARQKFKAKYDELYWGLLNPELGHSERIKSSKLLEDVYKCGKDWHKEPHLESLHGRDDWQVEKIEYGECGICGHPLLAEDYHRGDVVCEGCGTVMNSVIYEKTSLNHTNDALPDTDKIRQDEWLVIWLERRRKAKLESTKEKPVQAVKPKRRTDMKVYRRNQYLLALNSISSQLHMTQRQTDAVKNIILDDRYKLNEFHRKAGYKTVICGICRFVLCRSGRGKELRFNLAVFKRNNLNKENYTIIAMNIVERRIMSLMNP